MSGGGKCAANAVRSSCAAWLMSCGGTVWVDMRVCEDEGGSSIRASTLAVFGARVSALGDVGCLPTTGISLAGAVCGSGVV
jgi:hypothetical protein